MQRRKAVGEEHGTERERELVAQLRELLFPSPSPSPGTTPSGNCVPPAVSCRRRRGRKRVRGEQDEEELGGERARCSRRKKQGTRTLVTTVPDFDGYQWRKYGQKQIEAAKYPRSYYRCTNSTEQGCPAKRTVQRNDGGPPKYTVVYISEHTCKTNESAPPVILETAVRTKKPADHSNAGPHAILAPDYGHYTVVPAESTAGSSTTAGTESPAISEITWSGGDANPSEHGCYWHVVDGLFAVDDWDPTAPAAAGAALLREMDFTGPIRSPVHIAVDGWIDDLLINEHGIPSSWHLFGI